MPAVPHQSEFKAEFKTGNIYSFLADCQRQTLDQPQVVSLIFPLPAIAPWAVLQALGQRHQRHFYYDDVLRQQSVVAIDVAVEQIAQGPDRFVQAQRFIDFWLSHSIPSQPSFLSKQPRFFCSATFFESPTANSQFEPIHIFLPRLQVVTEADKSTAVFNYFLDETTVLEQIAADIDRTLDELLKLEKTRLPADRSSSASANYRIVKDIDTFQTTVQAILTLIQQQLLHKAVIADVLEVVAATPFNLPTSLQTLRQKHPDCCIFSVGNGQGQAFVGASPERLLSIADGRLRTDALAGSAARSDDPGEDALLAQRLLQSKKERYEHRLVVEFITRQLRSLGLIPKFNAAPSLLQLSQIQHLHTPIYAYLPSTTQPLQILDKLHPTPAVAGVPREVAYQLIRQYETCDRELYAAPLGWIDAQGNSEFIVGIRSALVDGCWARLYAGAGIVAGSEPGRELSEIRLKLQTLLAALV
ncbi:isochorismate synthase [Romeria aff. gracilis LEGE 07310]|uniref:isochorismate synthase n=1 Tax=Vasconcelosia minhoensis LEGE 07310 TaxID=915328 RepID=A0A8J7A7Y6_9CYAN|nr:isochorismate synthase [Romeria gracilis]MBE9077695.1 isochorismate synthase [Romeria aff. gracilis LEGE 07310]